jgi:recombination protein RecA
MTGLRGVDGAWGGATLDNGHYLTSHGKPATEEHRRFATDEHRKTQRNQSVTVTLDPGRGGAYTRGRRRRKSEMRAALESLLRARKLDVTLTDVSGALAPPPERFAPAGGGELDAALGGGFRRGHLSEVTGAASSGRTTIVVQAMAAAAARGEAVALVDACDTFDPASAAARGLDLARLLWVRPSTALGAGASDVSWALKAFSLILQAGGFGLVVLDLADVPAAAPRRFPWPTWMRLARIVEGSETAALLVGSEHLARSARGVTVALESSPARWQGATSRARVFTGVEPAPRVVKAQG